MKHSQFLADDSDSSRSFVVAHILSNYNLTLPVTCTLFSQKVNDLYLITSGNGQFIFSLSAIHFSSQKELEARAYLVTKLALYGISVSVPVQRKDGTYTQQLHTCSGIRSAWLLHFVEGKTPGTSLNQDQAQLYGETVANIHQHLDKQKEQFPFQHMELSLLFKRPLSFITPFLIPHQNTHHMLLELVDQLTSRLKQIDLPTVIPYYGICHGDLHRNNILIDAQDHLTVIDWDYMAYGWRVYDLAALHRSLQPFWSTDRKEIRHTTHLYDAYLRGYNTIRPLSPAEKVALPYFIAIRHIWIYGEKLFLAQQHEQISAKFTDRTLNELDILIRTLNNWIALPHHF